MSNRVRIRRPTVGVLALALLLGAPAFAGSDTPAETPAEKATRVRGEVYALLMQAEMNQRRGEYRNAAADLRKAVELQPDDPQILIECAELLERMGRLREAEDLGRHAMEIDPESIDAIWFVADRDAARVLGASKPDPKSGEEAIALYERLLGLGVDDPEVSRKLVGLRLQAGDTAGARQAAEALVARRPGDRQAVGILAQLLLDAGEHRQALRVLLSFITDHPNDSALIRLAEELARDLDAWDLVEEVFAQSAGFEDRAVEAQRLRGEALLKLDRVEPASRALEKVLLTDPTDRDVRFHLARTYRRMGRLGEALALARGLVEEAPADRGAHLVVAEILDDQGDVEGALNAYNTVVRLFSAQEEDEHERMIREAVRRRMVLLYLLNDQTAAAERLLDQLEEPDNPEALEMRARIAIERQDWTEARQIARKLRGAGEAGAAAMVEAESYLRSDRAAKAGPKIEEAVAAMGNSSRTRAALLYQELGMDAEGERLLREWVDQEPQSTEARFQLGSYLYRIGRQADSDAEMRRILELEPDHAQALNFLGYSFAERGVQLDEALELIQHALKLDAWNGAYLDSLAWVYFRMGRYADARTPIEQAARTYPNDPTVLEHLGDIYEKVGERQLAIAAWSRAIEAGAEDAAALKTKIEVVEVAEKEAESGSSTAKP